MSLKTQHLQFLDIRSYLEPTSTKRGLHTGAHCAHLAAAWGWCTRCAQPASMPPRSKYQARSGCHATRNHRNTGLQVNTENSNVFQFCASANVTMLQVCSSVHKKPIMFDFFYQTSFLGCMGMMAAQC